MYFCSLFADKPKAGRIGNASVMLKQEFFVIRRKNHSYFSLEIAQKVLCNRWAGIMNFCIHGLTGFH